MSTSSRPRWRRLRRLLGKLTFATAGTFAATPAAALTALPPDHAPDDDGDDDPVAAALAAIGGHLPGHIEVERRPAATAQALAIALAQATPLDATHAACGWATAASGEQRRAVAEALAWVFPLVGDGLILDHLARDPDPAIRAAAARAAWARRASGGDPGVLKRLADDSVPEVAEVARLALREG
ncbi:MAG: hypothetical protein K8W52_24730 [Deltaproteobacteria bacterium]|nr:hypothetical protein [Deltaproteobacteria bacterium]